MGNLPMRRTRLLYVENDPALRRILGEILGRSPELELIGSVAGSDQAMDRELVKKADVALIDFSLDQNGLNGIELGIALRNINEYIGICIYSQFAVQQMVSRVPVGMREAWSFFDKSAEMQLSDYLKIIKDTAIGKGNWQEVLQAKNDTQESESSVFFSLTPRQRSILSLSTQGNSPQEIAKQLGISYSYVRKELSRAYAILLPNADQSSDLKTAAVLKYMELLRMS
ncbi:MAG: response regulator [Actinobacteria bacterium]|nr:response regulator [Actinomycetota bacterium]